MKKIFSILVLVSLCFSSVQAQKLISSNGDQRFGKRLTTTDSTYTSIDSFSINSNEAGVIEATVIGLDTSGVKGVTGKIVARYKSASGTITLTAAEELSATTTDSGLSPATFRITSSGTKIYLQVKGKLTVSILWFSTSQRKSLYKSS